MKYSRVFIDAIGYVLPPVVISSEDLEARLEPLYKRLHIPEGQLAALTGIEERRWWQENDSLSGRAAEAGKKALEQAGMKPADLDAVIYTGVCRELFEPATACSVAAKLGVHQGAHIYDISNACLGVLNGIVDVANRIELGQIKAGMVVSCETAREINEATIQRMLDSNDMDTFTKCVATLTGGSGAVAVLITNGSFGNQQRRQLIGGTTQAAPQYHNLCRWGMELIKSGTFTQMMNTDSVSVLKYGVELGIRTWKAFLGTLGWTIEKVDKVICHQVGSSHQNAILKALGIHPGKDYPTYPYLGNIGTVSLPLTAALAEENEFLKPGDHVSFLGIGSGLNCLMLGFHW